MAHEFTPKAGQPLLPIDEITCRLKEHFAHVELDVERASSDLQRWIEWVHEARTRGASAYSDAQIERAQRAIGRSVFVIVADDPGTDTEYLAFTLGPEDEKIFVGYTSEEHEKAAAPFRERLARILDYEMELV